MKKITHITALFLISVFALVLINQYRFQKNLRSETNSIISADIISYPETSMAGGRASIIWHIAAPSDRQASYTTIFYDSISTPSALTIKDSPSAVGYRFRSSDYSRGQFILPADFTSTISLSKSGTIYFRAYAQIRGEHIWSEEKSFKVK